jgi:hypothetical protein
MADTITVAFWTVLCINMMLFMGQIAVLSINPTGLNYINCKGNIYGTLEQNNCTVQGQYVLADSSPTDRLPLGVGSVDPVTGMTYTDSYTGIVGWFTNTNGGTDYLGMMLSAPYNFLKALQLPGAFAYIVGTMWYAFTIFLVVGYLFGRNG